MCWALPHMRFYKTSLLPTFEVLQNMTKWDTFSYCSFFGTCYKMILYLRYKITVVESPLFEFFIKHHNLKWFRKELQNKSQVFFL